MAWAPNRENPIQFVLIDSSGIEVSGLGDDFVVELRKLDGVFVEGLGTKREIGRGWYEYIATADDADTKGPVDVIATAAGCLQQNLVYVVGNYGGGDSSNLPAIYTTEDCYGGNDASF